MMRFDPIFSRDAFVVRQIERGGLHAVIAVARAEDFVHDDDGREGAEFRVAIFRIDREMIFDVLQFAGKFLELGRLGFVLNGDERFEAGFVIEPAVLINFVGTDRRLDRAGHFHPRDVAVVIIVREKSVGARDEKFLERWFGRGLGGFAQKFRGGESARPDIQYCRE